MDKRINRINLSLVATLALCLAVALPAAAQVQRPMARDMISRNPDRLFMLKNALQAAGGTALSADQEANITTLITNFQTANKPVAPGSEVQAARLAYDNAILAGDAGAAAAQIPILVNQQTSQASARMQAEAAFAIGVVRYLTASQITLLQKRMGSDGVVRLIESLAGGPGGMGRGPGGPGRGAQGQSLGVQGPARAVRIKK